MPKVLVFFRALRSRNYRLYFIGQLISLTGFWLTRIATSWLVYRLTHSVFLLGVVNFASQIPSLFLLPLGGVLVDRWDKRRILLISQTLMMILSFILGWLTVTNQITFEAILILNAVLGIIQCLDIPTRHAFIVEMVEERQDLSNAIALNTSMFNIARLIGPSLGGMLIAAFGEGICFLVDGVTYFAVLICLWMMHLKPHRPPKKEEHVLVRFKEGFQYAFGFPPLRGLLCMVAMVSIFGLSFLVLLPAVAQDVLGGGPLTLGFLTAAAGIGALLGAFFLAGQRNVASYGKYMIGACFVGSLGMTLLSFSDIVIISIFFIMAAGFGFMLQLASCNTVIQSIVDDDKRGRVMSFYTLAFLGTAPFGSLLIAQAASIWGVLPAIRIGGIICLLTAVFLRFRLPAWFLMMRPIYIKKGILQEVTAELQ